MSVTSAKEDKEADHDAAEIECEVKRLICSSFMQEHHISNDIRLYGLSRTSCKAIEHRCPHEATIGVGFGSPDSTAKAYQIGCEINRSPSEGCAQWDPDTNQSLDQGMYTKKEHHVPDEIAKAEHKDSNTSELNHIVQI